MSEEGSTKRPGAARRMAFALFTLSVASIALLLLGELGVRWYLLGGPLPALRSFVTSPDVFVRDPDLGFKLNPESRGVNSLGILHDEITPLKPTGSFRVIVVGDSVAFDPDGFVGLLKEELPTMGPRPIEVINASIPGFTTYQELVLLKRDLIGLHPDLVILQYCLNDNYRFLHFLDDGSRWLLTPEAEAAVGIHHRGPLARWTRSSYLLLTLRVGIAHLGRFTGTPFVWKRRPDFYAAWDDASWPETEAYLMEMKTLLDSKGSALMVLAVPFEPQLSSEALEEDRDYTLKPQRRLTEICTRLSAPILDLFPAFLEHRDDDLFRDAIHLTERGHRLAATELLDFLRESGLAPSREVG